MIHHVTYKVRNYPASKQFYRAALEPLGYQLVSDAPASGGFGAAAGPDLWLETGAAQGPWHVAFSAASRAAVDRFHAAALAHGGQDNGRPGLRPDYAPTYYAAFVLDPDGNNIEAVCTSDH